MDYIHEIGKRAKSVSAQVQHLSQNQKNEGLRRVAEELENQKKADITKHIIKYFSRSRFKNCMLRQIDVDIIILPLV